MSKVLVVDDIADNVKLLTYDLMDEGYEVEVAYDGPQALAAAKSGKPDVILLDVMMPGMDGIEVCRRLRADRELRDTPVIMVSARDADEDVVRGLDAGADDYVTKPFEMRIVLARVR
jgi:DNA-binding response OmpR family regulator